MEIFLNLVWAAIALAGVGLWLRTERRKSAKLSPSLIALAMLTVILFPVISVSDDLWSIQNPAETDTTQRRIHFVSASDTHFALLAAPPLPAVMYPSFEFTWSDVPRFPLSRKFATAIPYAAENRPPPVC